MQNLAVPHPLSFSPAVGERRWRYCSSLIILLAGSRRAIFLFHGWLPFLLIYVVYRLGYDRRTLVAWTVSAWALMLIAYFLLPAPPAPEGSTAPVNVIFRAVQKG
jgi:hypothetical protein